MLQINSKGYLTPNKNIETTVEEFKLEFVTNFIDKEQRLSLFNYFIKYSKDLKSILKNNELIQWIDGSFVTKKNNPNDIDVVTFIDFDIFEKYEKKLKSFVYPDSISKYNVDGYIVVTYPRTHSKHPLYMGDWAYWMDRFDKTRRNRAGNRYPKGFVEINF